MRKASIFGILCILTTPIASFAQDCESELAKLRKENLELRAKLDQKLPQTISASIPLSKPYIHLANLKALANQDHHSFYTELENLNSPEGPLSQLNVILERAQGVKFSRVLQGLLLDLEKSIAVENTLENISEIQQNLEAVISKFPNLVDAKKNPEITSALAALGKLSTLFQENSGIAYESEHKAYFEKQTKLMETLQDEKFLNTHLEKWEKFYNDQAKPFRYSLPNDNDSPSLFQLKTRIIQALEEDRVEEIERIFKESCKPVGACGTFLQQSLIRSGQIKEWSRLSQDILPQGKGLALQIEFSRELSSLLRHEFFWRRFEYYRSNLTKADLQGLNASVKRVFMQLLEPSLATMDLAKGTKLYQEVLYVALPVARIHNAEDQNADALYELVRSFIQVYRSHLDAEVQNPRISSFHEL